MPIDPSKIKRVLLVDDAKLSRMMTGSIVKKLVPGVTVDEAENGRQGVDKIIADHGTNPFSAVILDFMMPDMNGLEVLEALKEANIDVPVFMATANIQAATQEKALELGAKEFLRKPLKPDTLGAALESIC